MKKMTTMLLALAMCLSLLIPAESVVVPDSDTSAESGNLIQTISELPDPAIVNPVD